MAAEDSVSARLAPKDGSKDEGSNLGERTVSLKVSPQDLEIRKFAVMEAVIAVKDIEILEGEEDYGKLIVDIAATIEDYIKNGKKKETK